MYHPDKPHAVIQAGANNYDYDNNGNMTSRPGATVVPDYDNRPGSVTIGGTTTYFTYDHQGQRVKKIRGAETTTYIGKLYECKSGLCTKHIFAGNRRLVGVSAADRFFHHPDHLGSLHLASDGMGTECQRVRYHPWGGTAVQSGACDIRYKFTGQEEDPETALYYYGARYYDPVLGRFISADTIVQNYSDPQFLNRYSYVRNNPLRGIDPTGHECVDCWGDDESYWDDFWNEGVGSEWRGGSDFGGVQMWWDSGGAQAGLAPEVQYGSWVNSFFSSSQASYLGTPSSAWIRPTWVGYFATRSPDADGYLTLGEAKWQWQHGGGGPLDVDLGRLDLSGLTAGDFPGGPGSKIPFRTAVPWDFLVHGTITLELDPSGQAVRGLSNWYDFDVQPWSIHTFVRNIETIGGAIYNGPGMPYRIDFYGYVPIPAR